MGLLTYLPGHAKASLRNPCLRNGLSPLSGRALYLLRCGHSEKSSAGIPASKRLKEKPSLSANSWQLACYAILAKIFGTFLWSVRSSRVQSKMTKLILSQRLQEILATLSAQSHFPKGTSS